MVRFKMYWWAGALLWAQVLGALAADPPSAVLLHPGDRIVFLGDSASGQQGYGTFVADYLALCHPTLRLSVRMVTNALWRIADGTINALPNVQADVLEPHPSAAIICLGGEDAAQANFGERQFPYFRDRLSRVVHELKQNGIAVILVTPAEVSPGGNAAAGEGRTRMIAEMRAIAGREQASLVDLDAAVREMQQQTKDSPPASGAPVNPAALRQASQTLAGLMILADLGLEGSPSSVALDAVTGKSDCHRCKIEGFANAGDRVSFSRTDEALSAPLPAAMKPVVALSPGRALNRYGLKVTGLKPGRWKLTVQDVEVGTFTADELGAESGIDLSTFPGPWGALGERVHEKSVAIDVAFATRSHYGADPKIPAGAEPQRKALVAKLDAGIDKLAAEQAEVARGPHTWNWSLVLQSPK